ncbi:hypothetical protein ILUMI_23187 [Ignelater luminosus]|uniref:Serpin domain-containing protein n=1 Tax=Ignelater luminosus TaxID=2038154 RepID=A0A8K0G235_IGNLU|nr:hypothetical protein ILUMI_23187 [Ignelater luminosus]
MLLFRHLLLAAFLLLLSSSIAHQKPLSPPLTAEQQYGDALEAIFSIAVRLQALLEDPDVPSNKNFMISPLSVALIVGQLMLGAEGRFRRDLYNLLSLPETNDEKSTIHYSNKHKNVTYSLPYSKLHLQLGSLVRALEGNAVSKAFTLQTTNGLFTNAGIKLKEEFLHNLQIYDTDVQYVNFSTDPVGCMNKINNWASAHTNGVIKKILSEPLPPTAAAVFTNAIYFRADWETPFSYLANIKGTFHSSKDETVEVEYMRGFFEDIPYAESSKLNCTMIAFPYKNNELAMYFMLPKVNNGEEYNIRQFADNLKAKDVLEFISQMRNYSVTIQMPKMKLSNNLSVLKPLQRYYSFRRLQNSKNETGDSLDVLEDRVDEFASFNTSRSKNVILTGAAENRRFRIENILQQMTLSVDEKGTEAAAVSLSDSFYMNTKLFRIDRPFVFFIRHESTLATLFWGTIVNPAEREW